MLAMPAAADPNAQELLERAFRNLYSDDYVQIIEIQTSTGNSKSVTRTAQIVRRQSERPSRALIRFTDPYDVRRVSVLMIERESAPDDIFVYLPAIGITRRLVGVRREDEFFGSALSYEDIEPKYANEYIATWAVPLAVGGTCLELDIRARARIVSGYDRMRSCVDPDSGVIHWTEFFNGGERVKTLTSDLQSVRRVGERSIPFVLRVAAARPRSETVVTIQSYEVVSGIPKELFSARNLEGGDAVWDRLRLEGKK